MWRADEAARFHLAGWGTGTAAPTDRVNRAGLSVMQYSEQNENTQP
jgi:hypothetical protein